MSNSAPHAVHRARLFHLGNVEDCAFERGALRHRLEAESDGVGRHAQQLADLKRNPAHLAALGAIADDGDDVPGNAELVHDTCLGKTHGPERRRRRRDR